MDWNSHAHKMGIVESLNGDPVHAAHSFRRSFGQGYLADKSDTRSSCDSV